MPKLFSQLFRLSPTLFGLLFLCLVPTDLSAQEKPLFGLWVEVEGANQPFTSAKNFRELEDFIEDGHFSDIYVQVYREGRAWFKTARADDRPYQRAVADGFDPLGDLLKFAHAHGVRVHAWVNVLRVSPSGAAPVLHDVGPEVTQVDNYGNSLLAYKQGTVPPGELGKYFKLETPGIWLDPSSAKLRDYLVETFAELFRAYPDLDGLHLDIIRYPFAQPMRVTSSLPGGVDYGYSPGAVKNFYNAADDAKIKYLELSMNRAAQELSNGARGRLSSDWSALEQKGIQPLVVQPLPAGARWDSWRRSQVTLLVFEIREMLNKIHGANAKQLSAAVLAWPDRAYASAFQDWRGWLAGNIVNSALPMAYTRDMRNFWYLTKQAAAFQRTNGNVMMGIGAWLMTSEPDLAVEQAKVAVQEGTKGVTLFSYSNLKSSEGRKLVRDVAKALGR